MGPMGLFFFKILRWAFFGDGPFFETTFAKYTLGLTDWLFVIIFANSKRIFSFQIKPLGL